VNPGFHEKMKGTGVPPGRPSRTTSGTRTTGWESLLQGVGNTYGKNGCFVRIRSDFPV